jgi:hypothetical protein
VSASDPATAIPLLRGLYWKDGDLRYDPQKDMYRFWKPVERSLWEPAAEERPECQEASILVADFITFPGTHFERSLNSVNIDLPTFIDRQSWLKLLRTPNSMLVFVTPAEPTPNRLHRSSHYRDCLICCALLKGTMPVFGGRRGSKFINA